MQFDQGLFTENFFLILSNNKNFSKLNEGQKQTIVEYFILTQNKDNKLKSVLIELTNFVKGMNEADFILHIEFEVALMKRQQKK